MADIALELTKLEAQRSVKKKPIDLSNLSKKKRVVTWDCETVPALAHVYQLKTRFIPHSAIVEPGGIIGWSWKWLDEDEVHWLDIRDGYPQMIQKMRDVLDEADIAVGQNSVRFDLARARGHCARLGIPPFSNPKHVDLLNTSKAMGFESASLDYMCRMMGVTRKVDNGGANNWIGAISGDEEAWERLETYGKGDITATEELFLALLPWLRNVNLSSAPGNCPRCDSPETVEAGLHWAVNTTYPRRKCTNCGGYFRTTVGGTSSRTSAV